jgi:hypothetical protein
VSSDSHHDLLKPVHPKYAHAPPLPPQTSQSLWETLAPRFKESIATFRLVPTTRDYIPPDKDPWKFF